MNVHLDTQYLYAFAASKKNEQESYLKRQLLAVLHNHNPDIQVKISFTALGETFNEINKKITIENQKWSAVQELYKLSLEEKVDLIPATHSSIRLARKLKKDDPRLNDTDILIVSQAICDREAILALFQDRMILESEVIKSCCAGREETKGYCNLRIKENFT